MKKNLLLLTILLSASGCAFAQKIKQEKFNVQYTQLPANPLDASFTTYSLYIYGSGYSFDYIGATPSSLERHFNMDGFKKVPSGGHFTIVVNIGSFRIESEKTDTQTSKTKDKDGKETVVTKYGKIMRWTMPISWRLADYEGKVLADQFAITRDRVGTYTSSYYSLLSDLNKYWSDNRSRVIGNEAKNHLNSQLSDLGGNIRYQYDFQRITRAHDELEVLREKDDGSEGFTRAYETVKAAFAQMTPDQPVDKLREAVKPAVDFWLKAKDQYDPADKKQKGVIHACLFNTATVFYWLDDLESAERYANQANDLDWKEGRSKRLLKEIEAMRKSFAANRVISRHINRKVESAIPPAKAAQLALEAAEEAANSATFSGHLVMVGGDTIHGKFTVKTEGGTELKFGPSGNLTFQYQKAGKEVTDLLKPTEVKSFHFNDRTFFSKSFAPGAKGNTKASMQLLEQLYVSDKVSVFKFYPYDNKLGDVETEFAYQKRAESSPVSIAGSTFLIFKKGLANYFADCTDLAELANADEFKKTEDDIIRAARVYAEMCPVKP